jgi:hypothetical protein
MEFNNNMGRFFDWLAKPMDDEDITAWYLANNITSEHTELFRDFCLSFYYLINETYLGDDDGIVNETKVGMTVQQKKDHFNWCWKKTIENFEKESIYFSFKEDDINFFESFFFEIFYQQKDENIKGTIELFLTQLFNRKGKKTKSDIEIFTDLYKLLERSLKIEPKNFTY